MSGRFAITLLAFTTTFAFHTAASLEARVQAVPAVIDASCAPWDGPAFEIRVPLDRSTSAPIVTIAIWQAPSIARPTVFRFPDDTQRLGAVLLERHDGESERLSGTVSLGRVQPSQTVTGTVKLEREHGGGPIERTFRAVWGRAQVRCGSAHLRIGVY